MEYLCIIFYHFQHLKDWTTHACHMYDSKYYKVLTITCCDVFRFCGRWIMIVTSSFTLQHTPPMRSCGYSNLQIVSNISSIVCNRMFENFNK